MPAENHTTLTPDTAGALSEGVGPKTASGSRSWAS